MACVDFGAIVWKDKKIITDREELFTKNEYIKLSNYITFKEGNILIGFYKNGIHIYDLEGKEIDSHWICYQQHKFNMNTVVGHIKFKIKNKKGFNRSKLYFKINGHNYKALIGYGVDPHMEDYIGYYGITKKEVRHILNKMK